MITWLYHSLLLCILHLDVVQRILLQEHVHYPTFQDHIVRISRPGCTECVVVYGTDAVNLAPISENNQKQSETLIRQQYSEHNNKLNFIDVPTK